MSEEGMVSSDTRDLYRELMMRMLRVRYFEERVKELYREGLIHGTLHLCVGEEASVIGATSALQKEDYILTTHRGHGECIGKGADVRRMMAEILGRENSTNGGVGGSMHITDISRGIIGSNGIVGAGAPTACGAALSIKLQGIADRVAVSFFGDGAINSGGVLESFNLAVAWQLPVVFILINNHYAVSTPPEKASGNTDFAGRARAFGLQTFSADGNDVLAVRHAVEEARAYTAGGQGPSMVYLTTYRLSGHSRSDKNVYRTEEEMQYWRERGPIVRFREMLLSQGIFPEEEICRMETEAREEIEEAVRYAKAQPYPVPGHMEERVYM